MTLPELKRILTKLMILNSNRMAQIRDSFIVSKDEEAEYEDRFKEREWYNKVVGEIDQEVLVEETGLFGHTREALKLKIQNKLESRYNEVLDKVRETGAGTLPDEPEVGLSGTPVEDCDPENPRATAKPPWFLKGS